MKKSDFIHLHTHSHYSLLQALPKIPDLVEKAKEFGMDSLALTDYGNMYGTIEFYKTCKKNKIKPIIGLDVFMAARTMEDKTHGIDNKRFPFTLLVKNEVGYKNLMKIVTRSHVKGFYYRPRVDRELLKKYGEGLICMSGPIFGEVGQTILTKNFDKAKKIIKEYQDIFGKENYFLEIMFNGHIEGLETLNKHIAEIGKEMDVELVSTQNSHYLYPKDREAFDTILGVSTSGERKSDGFMKGDFSFYNGEKMEKKFKNYPEAIKNTKKIADMCNLEIDLDSWIFPDIPIPEGKNYDEVLKEKTYEGIKKRDLKKTKEIEERIEYELEIIKNKGYSSYFLIMADMIEEAKKRNIYTNTRGSAAGSLVSYLNLITKVDPIKFKLPFERFMNPERPGIPDIDLDVADNRRDELIDYLREKYGNKSVAQIGTFGTMAARGSVRDVARALDYPYEKGDQIAKLIPIGSQGFPMTIDRALAEEKDLKKLYKADMEVKKIIDLAKKIEGCARHISVHAAGVVISPTSVDDFSPVQMDPKGGKIITQYDMYTGNRDGVVNMPKFDILGIRNLSILANAVGLVKQIKNIDIDLNKISLEDKKTYEMISNGNTMGVFQLSSDGMTKWILELKPENIEEISAMTALYRPGPMEFIPDYIDRKHNPEKISYLHPELKEILEETYGIIIYQEQVIAIANKFAGYSMGQADKFRKAMGKKIPEEMEKQHGKFIDGCVEYGIKKNIAIKLWEMIETFAAYGFNKAHSASYGRIAYETAYMKANFPVEYMTAMLSAESGDTDKIAAIIRECEKMNIEVLPPDINECFNDFTIVEDKNGVLNNIRFGFDTIKNFGHNIGEAIVMERKENSKFTSLQNILERIRHKDFTKKSLEALVMVGALDNFGERKQLLFNMESLLEYNKEGRKQSQNQDSLFGMEENSSILKLKETDPASKEKKLAWEKELLGLYVSGHPLEKFKERFEKAKWNIKKIKEEGRDGDRVILGGIIEEVKIILTKKNDKMAFIKITDMTETLETVVFSRTLEAFEDILIEDKIVAVSGKVSERNDEKSLIIEGVKILE